MSKESISHVVLRAQKIFLTTHAIIENFLVLPHLANTPPHTQLFGKDNVATWGYKKWLKKGKINQHSFLLLTV